MSAPNYSHADYLMSLYGYENASVPAAILGLTGFIVALMVHVKLFWSYKAWHFWGMYISLLLECVGFAARVASVRNPVHQRSYNTSYVVILLAPSFVAIGCFVTFGRIVWWVTPPDSHQFRLVWCSTRFVVPALVISGLISALIQLVGACFFVTTYRESHLGIFPALNAVRIGLTLQLVVLVIFAVVGMRFIYVSRRWINQPLAFSPRPGSNWSWLIWAVCMAIAAIIVRTVYRIAELLDSVNEQGYSESYEWPFWICDAVPMLGIFILFAIISPGFHLPTAFLGFYLNKQKIRNKASNMKLSDDADILLQLEGRIYKPAQQKWV